MLVISRKPGESFIVGEATITILPPHPHHPGRIRISIEAPAGVAVLRDNAKSKEARKSTATPPATAPE